MISGVHEGDRVILLVDTASQGGREDKRDLLGLQALPPARLQGGRGRGARGRGWRLPACTGRRGRDGMGAEALVPARRPYTVCLAPPFPLQFIFFLTVPNPN